MRDFTSLFGNPELIDTLKRALKKLEGIDTSCENLQTFLKCYRSSPNPSLVANRFLNCSWG